MHPSLPPPAARLMLVIIFALLQFTPSIYARELLWPCWAGHSQGCQVFPSCGKGYFSINGRWGVNADGSGCLQYPICPPKIPIGSSGFGFYAGKSCFFHYGPAWVALRPVKKIGAGSGSGSQKPPKATPIKSSPAPSRSPSSPTRKPTPKPKPTQKPSTSPTPKPNPPNPPQNPQNSPPDKGQSASLGGSSASGFLQRQGKQLLLNGKPQFLLGVNTYELAGSSTAHCKSDLVGKTTDAYLEHYFRLLGSLRMNMMRLMYYQAHDDYLHGFTMLDTIIKFAKANGVRLIVVLDNHWSDCTRNKQKDKNWYAGGYKTTQPGGDKMSYRKYVELVVSKFKSEPTIAMWQLMNEASYIEPGRDGKPASSYLDDLVAFVKDVSGLIKSIDLNHLVSAGAHYECWDNEKAVKALEAVNGVATVDVMDVHDYSDETWGVCSVGAAKAATAIGKPLIFAEFNTLKQKDHATRAQILSGKMLEGRKQGVQGFLVWEFRPKFAPQNAHFTMHEEDPLMPTFVKLASGKL